MKNQKLKRNKKKEDITYCCEKCMYESKSNEIVCPICGSKILKFECIATFRV